ncbi:MinD/ParA family ATP-binding protein [Mycobacterium seoulense]|uniref:MinD/ParA family ATP-binding protein n=1 Tax=Mycobacterium seoulense TaxID=386911 RepID=UPI0013D54184|nr:MinD/ParA family protein [Mycobacterium seoulense]MCV7438334.1 AAA family ATPase [Mycobacterium seoulense]
MAADYDRLFQSLEGMELPDEATAQTEFDVDAPVAMPSGPPKPNGHPPPPMPVDLADRAVPTRVESTPPPVDWSPPSEPARPPMPVDLPEQSDRTESPPPPPPMPVDPLPEPSPARVEPPPVERPRQPPPAPPESAPADRRHRQPPPVRPESSAPQPEPRVQPPAPQPRHARRADHTDAPNVPNAAPSRHGHRAESRPGRPKAAIGPSTTSSLGTGHPAPKINGGPVPLRQREPDVVAARPPRQTRKPLAEAPAQPKSPPVAVNGDRGSTDAVTHIGVQPARKTAERAVPQRGWQHWLYQLTRINAGPSRDEKYEQDLYRRIRRIPSGSHQIAVVGLKGGVGKTTVTVALGSALAQVRGDRILALDADADSGNLADRAGHRSGSTVAELLADKGPSHYNDVRAHTGVNAVNLEVLGAAQYATAQRAFSAADWQFAADAVSKFYSVVLADCGAGMTRGVLATASGVVIVTSASVDGARQAAVAIDWLRNNGHHELLGRACVVINHVAPGEPNVAITDLVRQFGQHVRPDRVVVLPWDKHIAAGGEIDIRLFDPVYKRRITELAAALSDDFDRGERR